MFRKANEHVSALPGCDHWAVGSSSAEGHTIEITKLPASQRVRLERFGIYPRSPLSDLLTVCWLATFRANSTPGSEDAVLHRPEAVLAAKPPFTNSMDPTLFDDCAAMLNWAAPKQQVPYTNGTKRNETRHNMGGG